MPSQVLLANVTRTRGDFRRLLVRASRNLRVYENDLNPRVISTLRFFCRFLQDSSSSIRCSSHKSRFIYGLVGAIVSFSASIAFFALHNYVAASFAIFSMIYATLFAGYVCVICVHFCGSGKVSVQIR